ncbi:MAG TPA: DNA internalization-related competence protein ComEC/Rec2 [Paucimonas sp.]|nr:DNA internalization-related competence protein ComEC/Rec2 [Paucimonas sp.]HJW55946.1 DNA internalization-related competence protein ComEC/Rec2 [Burkholderiaceae bacterium]
MRSAIVGFAIGTGYLQLQAGLPEQRILWLLIAIAALLGLLARLIRIASLKIMAIAVCGALAGFAWAAVIAHHHLAHALPKEWEGRDMTLIGTIDSLPYRFAGGVRFNFAVEHMLAEDGKEIPVTLPRIALSWYVAPVDAEAQAIGVVQPGERWQFTTRLQRPHGNANPYGFDYEAWLFEQDVRATGYVRPDAENKSKNERKDSFVFSFGNVVERCRGWLRERILASLSGKEYAGVIVALVTGDQRGIPQSDWQVFNRSGISHLVSISGLHITMIASLFAGLVFQLWRRSFFTRASLPLILPAQKAAVLAGVGTALLYVLLAGFGVPAQRTLYMLTVVAIALWSGRIVSASHVLCAALGIVVLLDPWAVLWPGFWLSFGAVAVILYVSTGRARLRSGTEQAPARWWVGALQSAARTQYAITLGLVPLTILIFGQTSLVSPVANAIAIPLISFIVTPLALVGSAMPAPLSDWLLGLAHLNVAWLARALKWLSDLPVAVWHTPVPAAWIFVCALLGALWLLAPRGWPLRWLGLAGWLPLLLNAPAHPEAGEMWVTSFDVGQGMALLIETPHRRLLYDTGPLYSPESDGGNRVVLPYLRGRGINRLDGVIVSHNDSDHSGGALSIFNEIEVGWVASSLAPASPIVKAAPNHRRCVAGQAWTWDGVRFEMMHPMAASYASEKWKPNARSCTLKITLGEQSILLAGDIEAAQETELVKAGSDLLRASVLLAPHHGSGTSSTAAFLNAVKPQIALFQVGYRNRYHHPKQEVFDRYGSLGIKRLRSDESGAVVLQFGSGLDFIEYRADHARYWHGR